MFLMNYCVYGCSKFLSVIIAKTLNIVLKNMKSKKKKKGELNNLLSKLVNKICELKKLLK